MLCKATCHLPDIWLCRAGITAVLETGWQLEQKCDPITRISSLQQMRISKASQQRRRGRAGRNQPGTCYTLYSKACYEKEFEEYGVPDVLKTNLDAFLLSMVAAGFDPLVTKDEGMVLLDQEKLR